MVTATVSHVSGPAALRPNQIVGAPVSRRSAGLEMRDPGAASRLAASCAGTTSRRGGSRLGLGAGPSWRLAVDVEVPGDAFGTSAVTMERMRKALRELIAASSRGDESGSESRWSRTTCGECYVAVR